MKKYSYIEHLPGHKDSKGDSAPWCIKSHETGEILSSHSSKEKAEEHLRQMQIHKHKGFYYFSSIQDLLDRCQQK